MTTPLLQPGAGAQRAVRRHAARRAGAQHRRRSRGRGRPVGPAPEPWGAGRAARRGRRRRLLRRRALRHEARGGGQPAVGARRGARGLPRPDHLPGRHHPGARRRAAGWTAPPSASPSSSSRWSGRPARWSPSCGCATACTTRRPRRAGARRVPRPASGEADRRLLDVHRGRGDERLVREREELGMAEHDESAPDGTAPDPHPGYDRVAARETVVMYNALAYVLAGPLTFGPVGLGARPPARHVVPAAARHPGRDGAFAVRRVVQVRFAMTRAGGLAPGTMTAAAARVPPIDATTRGDPVSLHVLGAPLAGLVGAVPAADGGGYESPTTQEFYQPLIGDGPFAVTRASGRHPPVGGPDRVVPGGARPVARRSCRAGGSG